jgi:hypothetical protein
MSIFTTDHPLTTQPSWFDARAFPALSFFCTSTLLATAFTPLILISFYFWLTSDIGAEPKPFGDHPWLLLVSGSIFSFVVGFICASFVVAIYRFAKRVLILR